AQNHYRGNRETRNRDQRTGRNTVCSDELRELVARSISIKNKTADLLYNKRYRTVNKTKRRAKNKSEQKTAAIRLEKLRELDVRSPARADERGKRADAF